MTPAPLATIAVCTANRARRLAGTLDALEALAGDPVAHEVIVVDNGSSDETPRLLADRAPGARFRAVAEPVVGLSAARNRAIREARGEWIAFLDDDALPEAGWLAAYAAAFADPAVDAAGGPIDPIFSAPLPAWYEPRFAPYLAAWDRGPEPHALTYNEYPRGANCAFRRAAFARAGDFALELGRRGRSLRSCEEIEVCLRLERAGRTILYAPAARVRHHVDVERLTPEWMIARFAAQGFSEAILEWRHGGMDALRAGIARAKRYAAAAAGASATAPSARAGGDDLFARCLAAAASAYRRGALYSICCVARYEPPGSASLAPFRPLA